jgi:hypothetical protein
MLYAIIYLIKREVILMTNRSLLLGNIHKRILARRKEKGIENWPNCKPSPKYIEMLQENLELLTPYVYQAMELNEKRM